MENLQKPDRKLILGLPPVAPCCLSPLIIIGVASAVNWLLMAIINLFR